MFFVESKFLQEIWKRSTQGAFQIKMKSIEPLWRRRFLKLHYVPYSENKPPSPRWPCFLSDQNFFKESKRGPIKEDSNYIIMKSIEPLWRRRFFKVSLYAIYSENKPRPRQPCFLSDQNFFKESKRGPPKEHSYQIIMKSIEPLWRRRFFKVSLYAI
jgi:hypothetical protein